jgi:hypothetical protein
LIGPGGPRTGAEGRGGPLDRPDQPTYAAGEPTPCAIPAAIGNAVFDATGARLRELPFTPERVKAALARPVGAWLAQHLHALGRARHVDAAAAGD